jgi:predicted MFS family arabinose efflux permease
VTEFVGFALTITSVGLLIFGLGALMGWSWGVKSLEVTPPRWIAGVLLAAGLAFVGGQLLRGEPALAFTTGVLFAIIVGSALRVGPFSGTAKPGDDSGG